MLNTTDIRKHFKALDVKVNGHDLVYLDTAATALKPTAVVQRIQRFYEKEASNVHRGAHFLSDQATQSFEAARRKVQNFIKAESENEIVFTKGTTEGINLIATSYGENFLKENDEIVLTELEHHANLVPWQNLALKKNLKLKFLPVLENGLIDEDQIDQMITEKTKIISFSGCSNILGSFTPIEKIVKKAKSVGAITVLDAAQLITQKNINVQSLDIDFLVFSAHKLFGPFGFGILYSKKALLEKMPPYQFGGSMISAVSFELTTYSDLPFKFEAGTPNVEGAVGTDTAIEFFKQFKIEDVFNHEKNLYEQASTELKKIPGTQIFGDNDNKAAILSFNLKGAHHSDVGQILDQMGIAVRVGHHCTQPLLKKFNMTGTVRASFSIYNNSLDVEKLIGAVHKAQRMLVL